MPPLRYELPTRGPFRLAASIAFLSGFRPGGGAGTGPPGHLHLAFVPDGRADTVGICARQRADGVVAVEQYGEPGAAPVRDQVARILGLDIDGSGFERVCRADPVLGRLWAAYDHLRPPSFRSPFEAGAWFLIGHRIRMAQAATIREGLAERLGGSVEVHGETLRAFPGPAVLRAVEEFPGLPARKIGYLHALSEAALAGRLDGARLRAVSPESAVADLLDLPGVGPFTAEGIVLRGAGHPDAFSAHEPRALQAVRLAYGSADPPDVAELTARAEAWRPYRAWALVLLRKHLADETGEGSMRAPPGRGRARPT